MANAPGQPNPQQRGSGFTNLSRIMQANQNNRLGSAIQSGITGGAQQVRQQLGDTRNQFNQAADANNLASDQNKQIREGVLQGIASGNTDLSQQQEDQFKQFRGGQYGGPSGLDSSKVAQLGSRASELSTQAKNPFSQNTLQATIGANSKQPYTQGQVNLDRTLLGTVNPNVLGQTRQAVRGLPQNVARERDIAAGTGMLRQQQAAQFGTDTRNQLTGQTGGITSGIENQMNQYKTNQGTDFTNYQNALKSGKVSDMEGLKSLAGQQYFNLHPEEFLNRSATGITRETVGTAQQKAQLDALAKLSGGSNDYLTNVAAQAYDPTKSVQFDTDKFNQAIAAEKAGLNQELNATNFDVTGADPDAQRNAQYFGGNQVQGIPQAQQAIQNAINDRQTENNYWKSLTEQARQTNARANAGAMGAPAFNENLYGDKLAGTQHGIDSLKATLQRAQDAQAAIENKRGFNNRFQ